MSCVVSCRKWQLAVDDYTFDLECRPPTPSLDLLTDYLEVKYADVLLKKDSVKALQQQLHQNRLAVAGELVELPPAAVAAPQTLSPAERELLVSELDLRFESDLNAYKDLVQTLYADGMISHHDMLECVLAADVKAEEAAVKQAVPETAAATIQPEGMLQLHGTMMGGDDSICCCMTWGACVQECCWVVQVMDWVPVAVFLG